MEFTPMAVVYSKAPNGNSNTPLSYQTFDYTPEEGVTYYRIKQTDFDGTVAYGKCVAVTFYHIKPVILLSLHYPTMAALP